MSKYSKPLACRELLRNDSFIEWRLTRSPSLGESWEEYLSDFPEAAGEFDKAVRKFDRIRLNDFSVGKHQADKIYNGIVLHKVNKRSLKRRLMIPAAAAACLALAVTGLSRYQNGQRYGGESITAEAVSGESLPTEKIVLLSGEQRHELDINTVLTVTSSGVALNGGEEGLPLASEWNNLIVPYGQRSTLILSDGTNLWVNSGSEVGFESVFNGPQRRIEVSGEVYIEVAHDPARPFIVTASDMQVEVLGTSFGLSSRPDGRERAVALIEGKVAVRAYGWEERIEPSQVLTLDDTGGGYSVRHTDVYQYISWKDGVLIFNDTPIAQVLEKIGRYYNIRFDDNTTGLTRRTCSGKLLLADNIDQVMNTLSMLAGTVYSRDGDIIYIQDKNGPERGEKTRSL
ncbi:MAG: FecR domain-containing protein [Alistipes sp.]|nr:FecR domain-containing protein [Alistipes sp.]